MGKNIENKVLTILKKEIKQAFPEMTPDEITAYMCKALLSNLVQNDIIEQIDYMKK